MQCKNNHGCSKYKSMNSKFIIYLLIVTCQNICDGLIEFSMWN